MHAACSASLTELAVYPQNKALAISYTHSPGEMNHAIFQIRTDPGELFVYDATGAQFGWADPLTPWDRYSQERIRVNCGLVNREATVPMICLLTFGSPVVQACAIIRQKAMKGMISAIGTWMKAQTSPVDSMRTLLSCPHDQFERARRDLTDHAKTGLRRVLQDMQAKGIGRTYINERDVVCAVCLFVCLFVYFTPV